MGSTFFGKVLRIPGASGSAFKFFNPTFASASSYESSMTGDGVDWVSPFDTAVGCPCYLNLGLPCMELATAFISESFVPFIVLCDTTVVTPAIGAVTPIGLQTPNFDSGTANGCIIIYTGTSGVPSLVTGLSQFYHTYYILSSVLVPGTLLPGNQWYCDAVVDASLAGGSYQYSFGGGSIGAGSALSATVDVVLCLLDFSAGLHVPPVVTQLSVLSSFTAASTGTSGIVPFTLPAVSVHIALGMSLPSTFVIGVGLVLTAVSPPGTIVATHTFGAEVPFVIELTATASPVVGIPAGITSSITQAP